MKKGILTPIIVSIILFIGGFIFWESFIQFSLRFISGLDSTLIEQMELPLRFQFSISCASIPLILFIIRKNVGYFPLKYLGLGITTILLFGLLFWGLRLFWINSNLDELSKGPFEMNLGVYFVINRLRIELFLFFGFILGGLTTYLIAKKQ